MLRSTSTAILLFLLGGAIFAPTTFAASIETYSNVLNSEEIDYFAAVDVNVDANLDEEGGGEGVCNRANKYFGAAVLDPAISSRIHDVTGTPVTAEEQRQYRRSIAVTKIMGDTEPHVDYHYSNADSIGTEAVEDKVAFIFLETNSDAKFVLGTTEIPAEAGKLVAFDGNLRHSTKVARGTLSIAGPFHLRTLSFVGPCEKNADCEPDETCECTFGRRLTTDDKNEQQGQRKLGFKRRALEELNEIHEREISTEEENKNFDERGPDGDADSSNRRRLQCAGQCVPNTGKSDKASSPKSSKAPKGSKGSKGTQ